ncbi:MAG: glycosyltransferase family 4 protein [Lachnospiraceae bacterium]|nr:glycosyltransferase family 4 protein [Lachnospiraceae bacterium]
MSNTKIFIAGDYYSSTGPAEVTKAYIKQLSEMGYPFDFLKAEKKTKRAIELALKIPFCRVVLLTGYSRQNLLALNIARIFGKKVIYLVHGDIKYENEINKTEDRAMTECELKVFEQADALLAVSEKFKSWLGYHYPVYKNKIFTLTNGIAWDELTESAPSGGEERNNRILSVGGGMPRKRIVNICRAIERLRNEGFPDLTLTVVGKEGYDTKEIDKFPFVNDMGEVGKEQMAGIYMSHRIFIQNSVFETFGLAPIEALLSGEDILLSHQCGVLPLITSAERNDVIYNPDDISEITEKLRGLLKGGNNSRLLSGIDREGTSYKARTLELINICKTINEEK